MKRVLITGVLGSCGSYLAEHLVDQGYEVVGLARRLGSRSHANLEAVKGLISLVDCDLCDHKTLDSIFEKTPFDGVFHVASFAHVDRSFQSPSEPMQNNILGTLNLLESIRKYQPRTRLMLCSSSEVYGTAGSGSEKMAEDRPIRPINPYAVSKATQDHLGYSYHIMYGLDVVTTRAFSYINPRRSNLAASAFARQIVEIEMGKRTRLEHGNLDSVRSFLDVRDIVAAYRLCFELGVSGEAYNIGSDVAVSIQQLLQTLIDLSSSNISTWQDPDRLRPSDISFQIPDVSKFHRLAPDWKPKHSLMESLTHLLNQFRLQESR